MFHYLEKGSLLVACLSEGSVQKQTVKKSIIKLS